MKKNGLDATTLRWVLLGLIVVVFGGGLAGAYFLQGVLETQVVATNNIKQEALMSSTSLSQAQALKVYLDNHQSDIDKTAMIVANTSTYKYQDKIVQDITKYAQIAGLRILGFDFPVAAANKALSTSGLNSITATITLENPVPYRNYLTFLKLIEQNLTKMQITDVSITPDKDTPSLINNPVIGLEVYIK